jgi:hypothetical protein
MDLRKLIPGSERHEPIAPEVLAATREAEIAAADEQTIRDAGRWLDLRDLLEPLDRRREELRCEHLAAFGEFGRQDIRGVDEVDLLEIEIRRPGRAAVWRAYLAAYDAAGVGPLDDEINRLVEEQCEVEDRLSKAAPTTGGAALALASACLAILEDHVRPKGDWPEDLFRAGERAVAAIERVDRQTVGDDIGRTDR